MGQFYNIILICMLKYNKSFKLCAVLSHSVMSYSLPPYGL